MKDNYLNRKLLLFTSCVAFSLIILFPKPIVSQQVDVTTFKNFEDWCRNKDSLNEEVTHTINVLLVKIRTSDCKIASEKLSGTWFIDLSHSEIISLLPLSSFTNLTKLNLAKNKIVDIKPLEKLTKLTDLGISDNLISDISPLRNMKDLSSLNANRNQISDVSPLQTLTKLYYLGLNDNKIQDITPLQPLKLLNIASFRRNPIVNKICPVPKPVNDLPICAF